MVFGAWPVVRSGESERAAVQLQLQRRPSRTLAGLGHGWFSREREESLARLFLRTPRVAWPTRRRRGIHDASNVVYSATAVPGECPKGHSPGHGRTERDGGCGRKCTGRHNKTIRTRRPGPGRSRRGEEMEDQ